MELLVAMSGYVSDFVLCTFIDMELSDSDDYLPEVCLPALHTSCYSQPNFIYGLVRCPHFAAHQNSHISPFPPHCIRFSMVCDFASSFYMILCMRLLLIHAYIHGM
jgi:hypothetical protein